LRHKILNEIGGGTVQETFYTLNLSNAKFYFTGQLSEMHIQAGMAGLQDIYKKLTKRFLFNEYIIKDEFDVFVAFETMNNRGKKLSDLELLKNRLIYLTTLYNDEELDPAERKSLRDTVNEAWKEVYHQLGRNKLRPLNDDDFLKAHWTMYFKYSRQTGQDYIRFLLDEQFTPQKIHKKVEREVVLELAKEQRDEDDVEDSENNGGVTVEETTKVTSAQLQPTEIRDFVQSLKVSAVYWFNSFNPDMATDMSNKERSWISKLNTVGIVYFRPLVMAILKSECDEEKRIRVFQEIERFIFIAFRMNAMRANYRSSEFYNAARDFDRGESKTSGIGRKLELALSDMFNDDGSFRYNEFYNLLLRKFKSGSGYYDWSGLRYFLYEYELSLLSESRQKKVDWSDLLKTPKDKISIEHVYPQTHTTSWDDEFKEVVKEERKNYNASVGNLLLLSMSINSSLQNDSFADKKQAKFNAAGQKIRNGYNDGSHSEIEVSQQLTWGPKQIYERGIRLLTFMEKRWNFKFKDDSEKAELLFVDYSDETEGVLKNGEAL